MNKILLKRDKKSFICRLYHALRIADTKILATLNAIIGDQNFHSILSDQATKHNDYMGHDTRKPVFESL